jgi:hypothetical protein
VDRRARSLTWREAGFTTIRRARHHTAANVLACIAMPLRKKTFRLASNNIPNVEVFSCVYCLQGEDGVTDLPSASSNESC